MAPAAHVGGLPPSKSVISCVNCPCTVASVDGTPVAAAKLVSALTVAISTAEPEIASPVCNVRVVGAWT